MGDDRNMFRICEYSPHYAATFVIVAHVRNGSQIKSKYRRADAVNIIMLIEGMH